jgi:hypothetical protein
MLLGVNIGRGASFPVSKVCLRLVSSEKTQVGNTWGLLTDSCGLESWEGMKEYGDVFK